MKLTVWLIYLFQSLFQLILYILSNLILVVLAYISPSIPYDVNEEVRSIIGVHVFYLIVSYVVIFYIRKKFTTSLMLWNIVNLILTVWITYVIVDIMQQ